MRYLNFMAASALFLAQVGSDVHSSPISASCIHLVPGAGVRQADKAPSLDMGGVCVNRIGTVGSSHAAVSLYDWEYTGPGVSGLGTLTANGDRVTSISGTANGYSIVGLSSYDEPDGIIFPLYPSLDPVFAPFGISFSVGNGSISFNLSERSGLFTLIGPDDTAASAYGVPRPGVPIVRLTSFTITPVPEPSTWATMLLGFMGLGLVGCRKARMVARLAPRPHGQP